MALCCQAAYAIWGSRCPTFIANPGAGVISEQKGVTRHIPQPEMPTMVPVKSLTQSVPGPRSAAQPPKVTGEMRDTSDIMVNNVAVMGSNVSTVSDNVDSIIRYLGDQRLLTDTAYDEVTKRVNEISESFDVAFSKDALGAGMTGVTMDGGPGNRGYVQTKQGTMIVLAARVSADVISGSITVEIQKNGILTGFQVVLDLPDHATSNVNYVDPGTYNYAAADQLSAVVTTSADFSPSPHIDVSLGLVHG